MTTHRSLSSVSARAITVVVLLLSSLAMFGGVALGRTQQAEPPSVLERTWPEGVELLAAQDLDLPAGEYQWQISTLTAPPEDAERLEVHPAILIAVSDAILVQINDVETIRLNSGAALPLQEDDEIVMTSAVDDPADYLLVELVNVDDVEPGDTENQVGPLTVPEGAFTMVLVNLPADATDTATAEEVIEEALRPGVLISHDDEGIPAEVVPGQEYDRWIVALYPSSDSAETPTPTPTKAPAQQSVPSRTTQPTATFTPTATATATATSTPTATATAIPTVTATSTATATATATATPTTMPTATATSTPTPTMVPPTNTPVPTPTTVPPTNTPVPTATP